MKKLWLFCIIFAVSKSYLNLYKTSTTQSHNFMPVEVHILDRN